MQQSKKTSNTIYDYAVIGSGLSGLCIASALSKISSHVVLIEANESFGGVNRSIPASQGSVNNGIRFFPATELAEKSVRFLEALMATNLSPEIKEIPPITFEAGGFKPFLGFGESNFGFYEDISYFTGTKRLALSLEPHEWTQLLFNNFSGQFLPKSYVTRFNVQDGRVNSVTINGQKQIQAHNFIFTGSPKDLSVLLPQDTLTGKALQKLTKSTYWTAICLDLTHNNKVTDEAAIHVLTGTTDDDLGPCAGVFLPSTETEGNISQVSQWISFIDHEAAEDSETLSAALKKIKRQIKRAYPEALNGLRHERILISPNHSGNGELKLTANASLPALENLWMGSGHFSSQKNLLGALLQSEMLCSALGCHPLGSEIQTKNESERLSEQQL